MSSSCINCNCKDNIQLLTTATALLLRQNHAVPPSIFSDIILFNVAQEEAASLPALIYRSAGNVLSP